MLVIGIDGGVRAWRRTPPGSRAYGLVVVLLIVLVVTIAGGMGLLVGGASPAEQLHFVYAVVALGVLPIADTLSKGWSPRRRGLASVVGAIVALIVVARLFGTG